MEGADGSSPKPGFSNEQYHRLLATDGGQLLDSQNLIDYILTHVLAGADDWPRNNSVFIREQGRSSSGFQFIVWDQEVTLGEDRDWITPSSENEVDSEGTPLGLFYDLLRVSDFQMEVADAIYLQCFRDGKLTTQSAVDRWREVTSKLEPGIIAESARWRGVTWMQKDWRQSVEFVANEILPRQYELTLERFRQYGWYPAIDPPEAMVVDDGAHRTVSFDSQEGVLVYYTLDGSDPRSTGGTINPLARLYTAPVALAAAGVIKARRQGTNGEWSALEVYDDNGLIEDASASSIRISEILYHPVGNADAEFIELLNISDAAVQMAGVQLAGGIAFEFSNWKLESGGRIVVVRDLETFREHFGMTAEVAGEYTGQLSNGGELVTLLSRFGTQIDSLSYDDGSPWPTRADTDGFSLFRHDLSVPNASAAAWQLSAVIGGTPGRSHYRAGDSNLDGRFDSADLVLAFQAGRYEQANAAEWGEGDWNRDHIFSSADLVVAFQDGQYETSQLGATPIVIDELFRRIGKRYAGLVSEDVLLSNGRACTSHSTFDVQVFSIGKISCDAFHDKNRFTAASNRLSRVACLRPSPSNAPTPRGLFSSIG